jgi:hypothetical protein
MKRANLIFLILILVFVIHCGKGKEDNGIETKTVDGVKHVYNSAVPLKGVIKLDLEKVFEIDSRGVDPERPAVFLRYYKNRDGEIYIFDDNAFKIYKFSAKGELLTTFLKKGEGPGEFLNDPEILLVDNDIWLFLKRKIAKFDSNGTFIEEKKLTRDYRHLNVIDNDRFIGVYSTYGGEEGEAARTGGRESVLIGKNHEIITSFMHAQNAGYTVLPGEPEVKFYHPMLSPDILQAYSHEKQLVYLVLSTEYQVTVKNLTGNTQMVIHREYQQPTLANEQKEGIMGLFRRWPDAVKVRLKANFPKSLSIFRFITPLPNGFLGLLRYEIEKRSTALDVFDNQGRFIYTIEPSGEISNLIKITFFKNGRAAAIVDKDGRDIYVEYKVKNLPELFQN